MMSRFLLYFVHEHVSFRWTEFLALTSKNNCKFRLISHVDHIKSRPFIIIELEDESTPEELIKSVRNSYLLKGVFELWSESNLSIDDLAKKASQSRQFLSGSYTKQTFRINCASFASKLTQATKIGWIRKLTFMEQFSSRPDLTNPQQTYCIFEMNEKKTIHEMPVKEYYFGRQLCEGNRAVINNFSLKERTFIANTSMDPMLSLISANIAKVGQNDIVYDPFVGSGGFLVAAAYMGAFVVGTDIDWKLLHGKSRPSRIHEKVRKQGECVRANLRQYNLEDRYIDVMVSDITRSPLREDFVIDSLICDPPYGIRECSEKIGTRKDPRPLRDHILRFPSKTSYRLQDLFEDLLTLSVRHLRVGGRLVYYLPVTKIGCSFDSFIPSHPCLQLISYCDQDLAAKISRLMIVMEKIRDAKTGDKAQVPQIISDMDLRGTYFGK